MSRESLGMALGAMKVRNEAQAVTNESEGIESEELGVDCGQSK